MPHWLDAIYKLLTREVNWHNFFGQFFYIFTSYIFCCCWSVYNMAIHVIAFRCMPFSTLTFIFSCIPVEYRFYVCVHAFSYRRDWIRNSYHQTVLHSPLRMGIGSFSILCTFASSSYQTSCLHSYHFKTKFSEKLTVW